MNESYKQAENFLNDIFNSAGLELRAKANENEDGCVFDIDGADASMLRSESGELLDALDLLTNQAFIRTLPTGQRISCDALGFRATREAELRAMAHHAAERVRSTGVPFTFGAMNANERRVIHVALADDKDLHTESIGEGNARRLKVSVQAPASK